MSPTTPNITAYLDVNSDGAVTLADVLLVISYFGKKIDPKTEPNPDVNRDGVVNGKDIVEVAGALPD